MVSKRIGKAEAPARAAGRRGKDRKSGELPLGAGIRAATSEQTKAEDHALMEQVVDLGNLRSAYLRVVENRGAPGVLSDGGLRLSAMPMTATSTWAVGRRASE